MHRCPGVMYENDKETQRKTNEALQAKQAQHDDKLNELDTYKYTVDDERASPGSAMKPPRGFGDRHDESDDYGAQIQARAAKENAAVGKLEEELAAARGRATTGGVATLRAIQRCTASCTAAVGASLTPCKIAWRHSCCC